MAEGEEVSGEVMSDTGRRRICLASSGGQDYVKVDCLISPNP